MGLTPATPVDQSNKEEMKIITYRMIYLLVWTLGIFIMYFVHPPKSGLDWICLTFITIVMSIFWIQEVKRKKNDV